MRWRKVTLIGVGLLGGSLGLALRKRNLAETVYGYVRRASNIHPSIQIGAVDSASTDLGEAVYGSDLIVFCTPLAQMIPLAESVLDSIPAGAILTDVGSVKGPIVSQFQDLLHDREAMFVGSHPMAGSEKTGVTAARENLFRDAVCVVTPTPATAPAAVDKVEDLWKSVGARTLRLSPEVHDQLVARSSHLPHVLAAQLVSYVLDAASPVEQSQLCATGFRDSTRIASGSPEMWRDIVLMNRTEIKRALIDFTQGLEAFQALLNEGDATALEDFFVNAKNLRDAWKAKCGSSIGE